MDGLQRFLIENYLNLRSKADDKYFMSPLPYAGVGGRDLKMSAALTPEGIVTQQSPGESLDGLDEKLRDVHPVYRKNITGKFELGKEIDNIYQDLMNSYEGREFVQYLRKNGNGTGNTGNIDDIFVVNKGKGMVAATIPDAVRKNLIINQDYIMEYANAMSSATGKSVEEMIKLAIVHELHHIYGQTPTQRTGEEGKIEYNNDLSLIKFYSGLAQKDVENGGQYLDYAKIFTVRYGGEYRKNMDNIIADAEKSLSNSYSKAA